MNNNDLKPSGSKADAAPDPEARCGLGHACNFCPNENSCQLNKPRHNKELIEARLDGIGHIFLVMANKGGVGKSSVSANLSSILTKKGFNVGLADCDVHGPNAARLFGLQNTRTKVSKSGISPAEFSHGDIKNSLKIASLSFMLEEQDTPVVWRDAYKHDYVHHLIGSFNWGSLDFLIIDMPPGTGNELITLTDLLEGQNLKSILVTSADAIALQDSLKASRFCKERGLPVLGIVENFAGTICPHCGKEITLFPKAKEFETFEKDGIKCLTRIPFSREIADGASIGVPASLDHKSIECVFDPLAEACITEFQTFAENNLTENITSGLDLSKIVGSAEGITHSEIQNILDKEKERISNPLDKDKDKV